MIGLPRFSDGFVGSLFARSCAWGCLLIGFLSVAVRSGFAARQSLVDIEQRIVILGLLDGLGDIIVWAIKQVLRVLFSPIRGLIEKHGNDLLQVVLTTPHPDSVFGVPSNEPWVTIHQYYWNTLIPIALTLYGLAIGIVILLESTSHLFSNYHRSKVKKRAFSGLLGVLSWWWLAALSLRFIDVLAAVIVPDLADISLFETISFSGIGVIGLVVTMTADLLLFMLVGLLYLMRRLMLFVFVLLMPLLIVLWIPGVGPLSLASKFMRRLAGFYVPFLFMTIPVAVLFRLGDVLGTSTEWSATGVGSWLTALVIPFIAVITPIVLFWQAGMLLYLGEQTSRHMSAQRARNRATRGIERAKQAKRSGRNFARSAREGPPARKGGQPSPDARGSRAHTLGQRVSEAGSRLKDKFSNGRGDNNGK